MLDVDYLEYLIDNTFYAEQSEPYIEVSQNELHNLEESSSEVNFNSAQETEFIESIEEGIMDKEVLFESMLETNLVNSFEEEGGFLDLVFEPVLDLMTYQKFAEDVLITEFQTDLDLDNTTEFSASKPHQVVTKSIQLDGVKNSILSTNNTHAIEFNEPITNINIVEVAHNLINKNHSASYSVVSEYSNLLDLEDISENSINNYQTHNLFVQPSQLGSDYNDFLLEHINPIDYADLVLLLMTALHYEFIRFSKDSVIFLNFTKK
ncbi:hypothetical protein HC766_06745 [Candidatus Gracilibacteria bacterium]|nr:hypothetical protein [Candidatus Gracilibacteria bacterium]